jgi:hypothetical protein
MEPPLAIAIARARVHRVMLARARRICAVAAVPAIAGAAIAGVAVPTVFAFPDGAPWEAAGGEGCVQCHFDAPPDESSAGVSLLGLPGTVSPGARYPLTIRLEDERLENAGFLLSAWQGPEGVGSLEAGRFEAADAKVATAGARARSTEEGSLPTSDGVAEWSVVWQAPASLDGPVVFELWANAGNDDKSPFGDATHRHEVRLGADAASADEKSLRTTE